ncbi:DEKNAAC104018 [Brettanomyces naardenensis]|uniref:DEKNAAC104018 n=1 Tax=Brettanomyces naardenensis TaxID=13370 RepID=A0A448YQH2_BRENA|nr:DEKNAAC104018 [Brettanomyces naardenensis]
MLSLPVLLLASVAFAADVSDVASDAASVTSSAVAATSTSTIQQLANLPFWQRLASYPWQLEIVSLSFMAVYIVFFYIGSKYNQRLVNRFMDSILPTLKDNFFQVGVTTTRLLAQDDHQHYTLYASGRLRVESLIARFELQSRQNPFVWIMELVTSQFFDSIDKPEDKVTFEFKIDADGSAQYDDFVWGIVTKDNMNKYRKDNYYLSLTKTSESGKLPAEFVFMNEVPEMNEVLFTKKLPNLLEKSKNLLQLIAITDQPIDKPEKISQLRPTKRIILQLRVPKSKEEVVAAQELLSYVLNEFIDFVVKRGVFRPELTRKCKKTRENEYSKLKRSIEDAAKEEANARKLEQEKDRRAKLSPEEQEKLTKRQSERRQRRAMNRQKVRT